MVIRSASNGLDGGSDLFMDVVGIGTARRSEVGLTRWPHQQSRGLLVLVILRRPRAFLTKPFGPSELLARIRVALRHAARPAHRTETIIQLGDLMVDLENRRVDVAGNQAHLTPTEYELLKLLLTYPDKVLTDHMLLESMWGATHRQQAHSLHVYVARLRGKIEADPRMPRHLLTEPGVGYRFVTTDT
jgi:DNA-binding response OmpR family regulator